jgi:hypothetical protein
MARKPETVFRAKFQSRLKQLPNAWFESIQQKSIGGTPDNLGVIRGLFVAIEYKATSKDLPTPLQEHKLRMIMNAEGIALVVHPDNADATFKFLLAMASGQLD